MSAAWVFPGQGSQRKGMGVDVLDRYPDLCARADEIVGQPIRELCANDDPLLHQTRYAQPVLFVIGALTYLAALDDGEARPEYLAGHSLGEYAALFAAGCFDFDTGVRLVSERGALMGTVIGGAMLATVGLDEHTVRRVLADAGASDIDVANINSPDQIVLSGPEESVRTLAAAMRQAGAGKCVLLDVSVPAHSRYMTQAAGRLATYLQPLRFDTPRLPVIANATAQPYPDDLIDDLLCQQMCQPVRWLDTMRYLIGRGVSEVREVGPGRVLTKLWAAAGSTPPSGQRTAAPAGPATAAPSADDVLDDRRAPIMSVPIEAVRAAPSSRPDRELGSAAFRADYGLRYAYLAGSVPRDIASPALLAALGRAGVMGYAGAEGLSVDAVRRGLRKTRAEFAAAGTNGAFGAGLSCGIDPSREEQLVETYMAEGIRFVEALAYRPVTTSLLWFRFAGAHRDGGTERHIVAHVGSLERAEEYLRPPPEALLGELIGSGRLSVHEAATARRMSVGQDICVRGDLDGDGDAPNSWQLLAAVIRLRERLAASSPGPAPRIGVYDDVGTPAGIAAAFLLGADFVVSGSINQCSAEAAASDEFKDMLSDLGVGDTAFAPTGELLDIGGRTRVARRGSMFAARSHRLQRIYARRGRVEELDRAEHRLLETSYFQRPLTEAWTAISDDGGYGVSDIAAADRDPRRKLALLLRWYFDESLRWAAHGVAEHAADFQVRAGPAMGGFNSYVAGTPAESWRDRHVDVIASTLMDAAAATLRSL